MAITTNFKKVTGNAQALLATTDALNNTTSPISVAVGSGFGARFPTITAGQSFWVYIYDSVNYPNPQDDPNFEQALCTSRITDSFTLTRSAAKAHSGKPDVRLFVTDTDISDIQKAVNNLELNGANPFNYGAIGDGNSHPLSGVYATLAAAQAVYPFAVSLSDELDWAAIQLAVTAIPGGNGCVITIPPGKTLLVNRPISCRQGTRIIGGGGLTSQIRASTSFVGGTGTAVLQFKGTTPTQYFEQGIGVENLIVDGNGQACDNIQVLMAQDQATFINVRCVNTGDAYHSWNFSPDVASASTVSQTIVCIGCTGIHKNSTATAATWYFQRCNETVLTDCKGWGGPVNTTVAPAWQFEGCSGMVMTGCSSALAVTGISVTSQGAVSNVSSVGHSYYGATFEAILTNLITTNADSGLIIQGVRIDNPRCESLPTQGMVFNNMSLSTIDAGSRPVTIGSTSDSNHIFTNDITKITDNGTNTSIVGWGTTASKGMTFSPLGDTLFKSGRPWADVRAYGAKGDGTTDDSTALQAAFTAIGTLGGTVFFPPGTYRWTKNLYIFGKTNLMGARNSTLLLDADLTSSDGVAYGINFGIPSKGTSANTWTGLVNNLEFKISSSGVVQRLINVHSGNICRFEGNKFDFTLMTSGSGRGGGIAGYNDSGWCTNPSRSYVYIRDNVMLASEAAAGGSEAIGFGAMAKIWIMNNYITGFGDDSVGLHTVDTFEISGNKVYSADGRFYMSNCRWGDVHDNHYERIADVGGLWISGGALIHLQNEASLTAPASTEINIHDNRIIHGSGITSATYGIRLQATRRCRVENNDIRDTSGHGYAITWEGQVVSGWTDPEGLDTSGNIRTHELTVLNNRGTGGGNLQMAELQVFVGDCVGPILFQGNIAGSTTLSTPAAYPTQLATNIGSGMVSTAISYTVKILDKFIFVTATGMTVTLPAVDVGRQVTVKLLVSGTCTVSPQSGTIDGASTATLSTQWQAIRFISDGINWSTI